MVRCVCFCMQNTYKAKITTNPITISSKIEKQHMKILVAYAEHVKSRDLFSYIYMRERKRNLCPIVLSFVNVKWLNGLRHTSYASYSCISSLFTSIFHLFAPCYVRFFVYFFFLLSVFASFRRQYIYLVLSIQNRYTFCRNTILVSLNHTNNVFESIIKTWKHEHEWNNAVLQHIIYKMNCIYNV